MSLIYNRHDTCLKKLTEEPNLGLYVKCKLEQNTKSLRFPFSLYSLEDSKKTRY